MHDNNIGKLLVLCLHGGHQTAEIFQNQLSKLIDALNDVASFEFLDAPFLLPLLHYNDDVRTRSWCCHTSAKSVDSTARIVDVRAGSCDNTYDPSGDYADSDQLLDERMQRQPFPDVLLGFSQGGLVICRYLMRHFEAISSVKAVVFSGTPDPRKIFVGEDLLARHEERQAARAGPGSSTGRPFLGSIPSLHIIGKKDKIVLPSESSDFAAACGPAAEMLLHEHAHSFPQLQVVFLTVRILFKRLLTKLADAQAFNEERANELEMIVMMYGEECVCNHRHPACTVVTLPLLSEEQLSSEPESGALARLALQFKLSQRYPAVLPELDIIHGPAVHNTEFEQWRADLVARCARYMEENKGLCDQMLLPAQLFANEQARESVPFLQGVFVNCFRRIGLGECATVAQAVKESRASEWELENEEKRAQCILETEMEATAFFKHGKAATAEKSAWSLEVHARTRLEEGPEGAGPDIQQSGGTWTPTIGLIGKPSAGKSTFFNAVTDPKSESEAACVAAFPFTTIEPNVGTGFGPIWCPCSVLLQHNNDTEFETQPQPGLRLGIEKCDACYGHVSVCGNNNYRRHPILVKDVAGLVQGAYQGKGKGNQFLNDLCDVRVLVHVVDGAGATDAGGSPCAPGQGSTLDDIAWVRNEVHNWIYDNIRAKWEAIRRTPKKLRTMFSGYHSSPSFVDAILQRMGIANEAMLQDQIKAWGPRELHLLVAVYVRLRFPMVVALNKADLPTAKGLAEELRRAYPNESFISMSAKTEWDLLRLRKKGLVGYLSGASGFVDRSAGVSGLQKEDAERLKSVHAFFQTVGPSERWGIPNAHKSDLAASVPVSLLSTGVQDVIAEAIKRCTSVRVYPVSAFRPVIPSLKHCFLFSSGTTADDVFWAMTYAKLLDGKLARFEALDIKEGILPITFRKTDVLPNKTLLIRVLSNKRQFL